MLLLRTATSCDAGTPIGPDGSDLIEDLDTEAEDTPGDDGAARSDLPSDGQLRDVVIISVSVDDRANQAYGPNDGLAWAGSFKYDPETNYIVGVEGRFVPPFPMLWDDGPLSRGGHEPEGSEPGDHVWSVAVLHTRPSSDVTYFYSVVRGSVGGSTGDSIWPEPEGGQFTIPATAISDIEAPGVTVPPFGRYDYRITVDGNRLDPDFLELAPLDVSIKGVAWGLTWLPASDDGSQDEVAGDGVYSFVASHHFGADCAESEFPFCGQTGLANSGDPSLFWVAIDGIEYGFVGVPLAEGITVEVGHVADAEGNAVPLWTPVALSLGPTEWQDHGRGLTFTVP